MFIVFTMFNVSSSISGLDAGCIDISVKSTQDSKISIIGLINSRFLNILHDLSPIILLAKGCNGHHGSHGYNGQPGQNGQDGSNAGCLIAAGNGSDGQNGQDGGLGTSGTNGTNGGIIRITIDIKDTYLLSLLQYDYQGGKGGVKGSHGQGGLGGKGGKGGSSHCELSEGLQHYMSGGSDGRDGHDGITPSTSLHDGLDGSDGKLIIKVIDGQKTHTYNDIYDIAVIDYKVDSVYQPGDIVQIDNVCLTNKGNMPTPTNYPIKVFTYGQIGETPETKTIIKPFDRIYLEGSLRFQLDDIKEVTDYAPKIDYQHNIYVYPFLPIVNKSCPNKLVKSIRVTFPLELVNLDFPKLLPSNQEQTCLITIMNISQIPQKAQIVVKIISDERIYFDISNERKYCSASDQLIKLDNIVPGLTQLTFKIGQSEIIRQYNKGRIDVSLMMESKSTNLVKTIQKKFINFQSADSYIENKDSQVLLITNHLSSESDINQIKHNYEQLNINIDIWNQSGDMSMKQASMKFTGSIIFISKMVKDYINKLELIEYFLKKDIRIMIQDNDTYGNYMKQLIKSIPYNSYKYFMSVNRLIEAMNLSTTMSHSFKYNPNNPVSTEITSIKNKLKSIFPDRNYIIFDDNQYINILTPPNQINPVFFSSNFTTLEQFATPLPFDQKIKIISKLNNLYEIVLFDVYNQLKNNQRTNLNHLIKHLTVDDKLFELLMRIKIISNIKIKLTDNSLSNKFQQYKKINKGRLQSDMSDHMDISGCNQITKSDYFIYYLKKHHLITEFS